MNRLSPISLENYARFISRKFPVVEAGGIPWFCENRILLPLASPHMLRSVLRKDVKKAMKKTGALVAAWNEEWDTDICEWWWICCDQKDYDISSLSKKVRYDIRKGLSNCHIRQVEAEWLSTNGWGVYIAAFSRYGTKANLTSPDAFRSEILRNAEYPGREMWGAFFEGKLVAFASCIVIEDAVQFAWAKSDPKFHHLFPNNALYYELTRHYLCERGFRYVADGSRAIRHETNIQSFLNKLGYRRIYCPLCVEIHPILLLIANAAVLGRPLWKRLVPDVDSKLSTIRTLNQIARSCQHQKYSVSK